MRIGQDQLPRGGPTVGDTLTVVQRVSVPAGALVQPRGPTDSLLATLVGTPAVTREGDSVRIAYTLAVWTPGEHQLNLPGAVVLLPGGQVDTLPEATVALRVASVLPSTTAVDSLTPRAARPWVPQADRSVLPFAVILLPLLLVLAAVTWWWRRRGPLRPPAARRAAAGSAPLDMIERWLAAGETELAIDHLLALVPADAAGTAWREAVRRVRFTTEARPQLAALADEGRHLVIAGERTG